jgi:hypothetical protein
MAQSKTSWKPGQSGNPKGRAKKDQTLTAALKKFGKKRVVEIDGKKYSRKDALAIIMWEMALRQRYFPAIKYLYDRMDGLPKQQIDANLEHGGEIIIKRIKAEDEE